jgi:hypothetical protein
VSLTPQRISPPIKGLNTTTPIREMTQDYAVALDNVWFDQAQAINRRAGQRAVSTAAISGVDSVEHMFEHVDKTNGVATLFAWANGNIRKWVSTHVWSTVDATFTARPRTAVLDVFTVVADGVNPPKKYNDAGGWTLLTTLPATAPNLGTILHSHKARMYASGNPTQPTTLYYSDVSTSNGVDDWSAGPSTGGFVNVGAAISEGDKVTGLTSYKGFLVVFLENHIVFYSGNDPDAVADQGLYVEKVITGIGCLSQDTIQGIGNDTIFLSKYGFKSLEQIMVQGDAAAKESSVPINNFVLEQIRLGKAPIASLRSEFVEEWGVYLCTFGSITLVYHTFFDSWSLWRGMQPVIFKRLAGDIHTCDTHMHVMDTSYYGDTLNLSSATEVAIPVVWELPPIRAQGNEVKARWNRIELIFESEAVDEVNIETWVNLDKGTVVNDTLPLAPTNEVVTATGMVWASVATSDPRRKWSGTTYSTQWAGSAAFYAGSEKLPVGGRSELFSVRVTHNSIKRFKITALEVYSNSGGLR